jgi:hypothetical protein
MPSIGLPVLALAGLLAAVALPFLAHAPNRLVSGRPVSLGTALHGWSWLLLAPGAALLVAAVATTLTSKPTQSPLPLAGEGGARADSSALVDSRIAGSTPNPDPLRQAGEGEQRA